MMAMASLGGVAQAGLPVFEPYQSDGDTALLLHFDGDTKDASGGQSAVSATGARWTADGIMGKALACNGKQSIAVPNLPDLTNGFTVEAWVWLERPAKSMQYSVLSWRDALELECQVYPDLPMKPVFRIRTDKGRVDFRTTAYVDYRRWVHLTFTYDPADGKGDTSLLLHGQPVRYRSKRVPNAPGRLAPGKGPARIARGLVGAVDELRISTRARTAAELHCLWPSGRRGDFQPFRPDVIAPPAPNGWNAQRLWLSAAQAVPTFNSLGLYVPYAGDSNANAECRVRCRKKGDAKWRRGMDLIRDREDREFRGSLLMLDTGTDYEVEMTAADPDDGAGVAAQTLRLTARTWSESTPVGEVRTLPAGESSKPLVISTKGKPDAWIMFAPATGETSVIDVGTSARNAILIHKAAYVIVQGVTARGGTNHCVRVVDSHHIRIRRCEMTGWGIAGKPGPDGRYVDERGRHINLQAGVRVDLLSSQVVVEDNFIHTPRGTANSWWFGHPMGPQGVILGYGWNNVVRNNEIIGSEAHWWNDAIESQDNGGVTGGPYRDTDIYGNVLAFANDDGTELDGGQINVRYWHNWIEKTLCGISFAPDLKGPSYAFRNVIANLGDELGKPGNAFKMGYGRPHRGLSLMLHNTRFGPGGGPNNGDTGRDGAAGYRCFVRNNLVARPGGYVDASESSAIAASNALPVFLAPNGGEYRLASSSPGIDAGLAVAGFNDDFAGKAPDMGAYEYSARPLTRIPYRQGMIVRPRHIVVKGTAGEHTPAAGVEVALMIPKSVGATWTARPNSPWIRCRPPSCPTSDAAQTITVSCDASEMAVRPHRGAVVFHTDHGLNVTLMVDASVYHKAHFAHVVEAEDGKVAGGMKKTADERASNGAFVHAPERSGTVTFTFDVPADGLYYVLGRCLAPAPSGSHDSFFFSMDGAKPGVWDVHAWPDGWWWDLLNKRDDKNRRRNVDPRAFQLSRGRHTLTLKSRESDCRLDRIAISNSPHAP